MRSGADYRESLRDGRKVWVLGQGRVEDVTTDPATAPMVDEHVKWYDRHFDPAWRQKLLAPDDASTPVWAVLPRNAGDLRGMGASYASTLFLSGGNVTHTPGYGGLIALGILDAVQRRGLSAENEAVARAYRDRIAQTGRFLTFSNGAATIGYRMREDVAERVPMRLMKESKAGIIVSGRVGMHTSVAYAQDVYLGTFSSLLLSSGQRATFVVEVASPGVTVVCRKVAARHANPFVAPMSSRFDELDAHLWLENVFVPWERVFLTEPAAAGIEAPEPLDAHRGGESIVAWLWWHQLYCWLAKAEFTLGLALACTDAMGLREHQQTVDHLVDLVAQVQTVRCCIDAAELDPELTATGYALPRLLNIAAGSLAMLNARQRMAETLRTLPGSSMAIAPADTDLADAAIGPGLEETFGGGGYTARQRAALLNLTWDHVCSGLDARESAFELHANGGAPAWRTRLRTFFTRYTELASGVLGVLDLEMPEIDLGSLRNVVFTPRRPADPTARSRARG